MDSGIDLAVISVDLEGPHGGLVAVRHLRSSHPRVRTVILANSLSRALLVEAFRCGARGIFSRHEDLESLSLCIECVHRGQIWPRTQGLQFLLEALMDATRPAFVDCEVIANLSKQERVVMRWIVAGLRNRAIAERMRISDYTVKHYLTRIYAKLGVSSRGELMSLVIAKQLT